MHKKEAQTESFVIQVIEGEASPPHIRSHKFNLSAMKLFSRFRKILMRLIFSVPSSSSNANSSSSRHRNSDRFDPPKTSCSSYYSSYSHYNEAISDCIEFFNKSAQDPFLDPHNSHVDVV